MVIVARHREWVVDVVSCRNHHRYARAYVKAAKRDKGRVLDQVVEVTGWSPGPGRSTARRPRKPRASKYSYDALEVPQRVWAASGGQYGKYLAASMRLQLDGLQRHGELAFGRDRYSTADATNCCR